MRQAISHIELLLFMVLIMVSGYVMAYQPWCIDPAAASSLSGALFGGAALLLGNWINRINDRYKAEQEQAGQIENLKTLIAGEMINVAVGLIAAKQLVDSAIISLSSGGSVSDKLDMNRYRPRLMPMTESLGPKLLTLERSAIDAITTLRSNLALTRDDMDEVTAGQRFGMLVAQKLSEGLGHDMKILSEVFTHIAPTRKLKLREGPPELAITILNKAAQTPEQN